MKNNMSQDEAENSPPKRGTRKDRIEVLLARIEKDIDLLREARRIDELSAYETEQSIAKHRGLYLRLLALLVKVEDNEPQILQVAKYNLLGERKITPGQPTPPDRLFLLEDEDEELKG